MSEVIFLQNKILEKVISEKDDVLSKFIHICGDKLYYEFTNISAKGGLWAKNALKENKNISNCSHDQNMYSHIFNGLMAVTELINQLEKKGLYKISILQKILYMVSFALHDIDKIKGAEYKGKKLLNKQKEIIEYCKYLNFDVFFKHYDFNIEDYINDIIYNIINTELTNPVSVNNLKDSKEIHKSKVLCTLSDKITYFIKKPSDISNKIYITENIYDNEAQKVSKPTSIQELIAYIANDNTKVNICYHQLPESKGVLGNIIHNSISDIYKSLGFTPYLIFAEGIIYIGDLSKEPDIYSEKNLNNISNQVWNKIKSIITDYVLYDSDKKFKPLEFDLQYKKIKHPDYYLNFIDENMYLDKVLDICLGLEPPKKNKEDKTETEEITILKQLKKISNDYDYTPNQNIVKVTRYFDFLIAKIDNKEMLFEIIFKHFELDKKEQDSFYTLRDKLNENKLQLTNKKLALGELYWLSHLILDKYYDLDFYDTGYDDTIQSKLIGLNKLLLSEISNSKLKMHIQRLPNLENNVKNYIKNLFSSNNSIKEEPIIKCSICNCNYDNLRQDDFVPFQKTTYKNKLPLNIKLEDKKDKLGYICQICYLEFTLRQMKIKNYSSGVDFESKKINYIHFYPNYFFTSYSIKYIYELIDDVFNTNINEILRQFISINSEREFKFSDMESFFGAVFSTDLTSNLYNFSEENYDKLKQETSLSDLIESIKAISEKKNKTISLKTLLKEMKKFKASEEQIEIIKKITLKVVDNSTDIVKPYFKEFSEDFIFNNINIGKSNNQNTDTEASVVPTFLNLFLSLVLNCKTVLTTGLTNTYSSQNEIKETVIFNDMNQSLKILLGQDKFLIDEVFENLKKVLAIFSVCYESFSTSEKTFNYVDKISREIASDKLSIFAYYRRIKAKKLLTKDIQDLSVRFINYMKYLGGTEQMDTIREITTSYRKFHKAFSWHSSYKITRPVRLIFETLLKFYHGNLSDESIRKVLYGQLRSWSDRSKTYSELWGVEKEEAIENFVNLVYKKIFIEYCKKDLSILIRNQHYLAEAIEADYYVLEKEDKK